METDDITSSHSETESFRRCKRAHFYSRGLRVEPVKHSLALLRGNVGHNALAYYYQGLKDGKSHDQAVERALSKGISDVLINYDVMIIADVLPIMRELLEQYFEHFRHEADVIEVVEVEKAFEVEVADGYTIRFVIDLILRYPKQGLVVWDHKIVYNFFNPTGLDISPQLPMYIAGCRMLGIPVSSAHYNELRWYLPKKDIGMPHMRFRRQEVPISHTRVMRTLEEQVMVGEEIAELRKLSIEEWDHKAIRCMNTRTCDSCGFAKLCTADLNGNDRRLYIGMDYRKKPERV